MALTRDLLLHFRHRPNAIFSNIASFALKAAGGDDWLKKYSSWDTMYSFKLNEGQHVCRPYTRGHNVWRVLYKTTGGLLRNNTEVHTALPTTNRTR